VKQLNLTIFSDQGDPGGPLIEVARVSVRLREHHAGGDMKVSQGSLDVNGRNPVARDQLRALLDVLTVLVGTRDP
jgi:hypothetical protein